MQLHFDARTTGPGFFTFTAPAAEAGAAIAAARLMPVIYSRPLLHAIMADVARDHGMNVAEIVCVSRARRAAWARQDFMYRARLVLRADGTHRYSFPAIARWFNDKGGRTKPMDHTTVFHGARREADRRREALMARIRRENAISALLHGKRAA